MSVHQKFMESLKNFPVANVTLPPASMIELALEYIELEPGVKMTAKVPFQKRFTNPIGVYQGGFLTAAIDDVFGPLSFVTSNGPTVTISMNTTYLGTFKEEHGYCTIHAVVLKKTKNFIFLRADVKTPDGELIAHAETHVKVL
jgi:acyl-coenzyme A thioesterase PaaI-like protein